MQRRLRKPTQVTVFSRRLKDTPNKPTHLNGNRHLFGYWLELSRLPFLIHFSFNYTKQHSMKKTIQYIAMAALCFFLSGKPSAVQAQIKPLKIGDMVPDEVWKLPLNVLNHPAGKTVITLNDYKGNVIILDFWATWCGACIASFPKARKIQDSLPGKVSFVATT